jgi:glucosamine-6-phosphate deaminase
MDSLLRKSASLKTELIKSFRADRLNVFIYESRRQTAAAAAAAVAAEIRRLIAERGRAVGIFSSASSQTLFLGELVGIPEIGWTRVIGFHLDEYLGASEDSPQSSRKFLIDRLVRKVPMAEFHGLRGEAANPEAVCANYAALLDSRPPDFAVPAIGEDGRLASIASSGCDFDDPAVVRVVDLDGSRRAISLTIPTILKCQRLFVVAPGERLGQAVRGAVEGEITPHCPASILRTHPDAHLFLDRESAGRIIQPR